MEQLLHVFSYAVYSPQFIFCPFLEDGVLERVHARKVRREELTNIMRKKYAKLKYKYIPSVFIDLWIDKKYLLPLRLIGIILELIFKVISMIIKLIKKTSRFKKI